MSDYYGAAGYVPRAETQGERHLEQWLRSQVRSGQLDVTRARHRRPMVEPYRQERFSIIWERYVWNFTAMRTALVTSRGYIELLRSTNRSGVSSNTWYVIRCLPTTNDQFYLWRFGTSTPSSGQRFSDRDLGMHLGYNRQYNLTLSQRIRRYNEGRGLHDLHSRIVNDMAQLGRNLIMIACFRLVARGARTVSF